jgi:hypothetical protein
MQERQNKRPAPHAQWSFVLAFRSVFMQCITRNDPAPLVGKQRGRAVRGAVQLTLLTLVYPK